MNVYLNGRFLPLADAKISVLDRGFVFGDGVYELVPVYSKKPFRLDEHLRRLQASLDGIRLANPHGIAEWRELILQLIALQEFADQSLYIQVRAAPLPARHAFPQELSTIFCFSGFGDVTPRQKGAGVCAVCRRQRWLRCNIKAISLLANILRQQAVDADCAGR
jgi:D-alanine transaminase